MINKRISFSLVFSLLFLFFCSLPVKAQVCFRDCSEITTEQAQQAAQGGDWRSAYQSYIEDAHCTNCYNNAMKIQYQARQLANQRYQQAINRCSGTEQEIEACRNAATQTLQASESQHRQLLQNTQQIVQQVAANNDALCAFMNALTEEYAARLLAFTTFQWATTFTTGSAIRTPLFSRILNSYNQDGSYGCWFCPLFDVTFDIVNDLATNFYEKMRNIFLSALMVGGVAWLCWIVLQFFLVVHGANVGEFMTSLLKAFFRLMFGAALLWAPSYQVFDLIITPVVSFATGLSTQLMGTAGFITPTVTTVDDVNYGCSSTTVTVSQNSVNLCSTSDPNDSRFVTNGNPKALSSTVYDGLSCVIKTASLNFVLGMAIAATFLVHSLTAGPLGLPHIGMFLIALIQIIGYLILFIVVPFKFIDILVRLGFVAVLLPLYIVLAVFPATIGYTKKAWDLFISCLFTLIVLSILIVICLRLIAGL